MGTVRHEIPVGYHQMMTIGPLLLVEVSLMNVETFQSQDFSH